MLHVKSSRIWVCYSTGGQNVGYDTLLSYQRSLSLSGLGVYCTLSVKGLPVCCFARACYKDNCVLPKPQNHGAFVKRMCAASF